MKPLFSIESFYPPPSNTTTPTPSISNTSRRRLLFSIENFQRPSSDTSSTPTPRPSSEIIFSSREEHIKSRIPLTPSPTKKRAHSLPSGQDSFSNSTPTAIYNERILTSASTRNTRTPSGSTWPSPAATGMNVQCQCGSIKFLTPLLKPLAVYICHCDECRRQSSSAFGCSAIFPKFELPSGAREWLSCYSRPTTSGHQLNCFFCKNCGTRLIHSTPGKDVVSVKGGCIEGLDWKSARHIWCKRAMVPIPEGVERDEEEPTGDLKYHVHSDIVLSDGGDESRAKAAAEIPGALASMSILRNTKSSRILKAGENDDEIRG